MNRMTKRSLSPSASIFPTSTSSSEKKVISDIVATQNIIKNKFKHAYAERMKRERERKKIFKPVTKALETIHMTKDSASSGRKVKLKGKVFETMPFRPSRFATSTPSGPLQKRLSYDDDSSPRLRGNQSRAGTSDVFHSILESSKTRTKRRPIQIGSPPKTRLRAQALANINTDLYTYSVRKDYDTVVNYNKPPADNILVEVNQVRNSDGTSYPVLLKFRDLPQDVRNEWIEKRKSMFQVHSPRTETMNTTNSDNSDDYSDVIEERDAGKSKGGAGFARKRVKSGGRGDKALDFNFIPYNANDRIVYEYFDDPNEICDRLRLLISSRMGGNTNHAQEINSIVEELRELGCIF